ncbi:hypothetical protein ACSIGC_09955 [Tenacibaculum sp. ZS6-P6]|uniref:hypothetical protein n=1 Tax=Tenacibaculum sp. ZS6-P6 TaxID=3447503 RepID=UPI003F98DEA7
MRKTILTLLFLLQISLLFPQKKEQLKIFENKKNWKTEIIEFPINWAPKVKLTGFEELIFTPNWSDPKNDEFWSLIMGWKIDSEKTISLKEIENNFKNYFDGVMKPNHWSKNFPQPKVIFQNKGNGFFGTMTFFDGFHTGKMTTVNIQGKQFFDKLFKESIITFYISPKDYNNPIWNSLKEIETKQNYTSIFKLDTSWGKEVFPFPIPFAKNINYEGIAEVRFPPEGWRNPKHSNFWSYVYAWSINLDRKITEKELAINLQKYFDGLNHIENNKHLKKYKASAKIQKNKIIGETTIYIGEINTYDRFATNTTLKLNVIVESNYCKKNKKNFLLFKFSPKDYNHKTWIILKSINLVKGLCN